MSNKFPVGDWQEFENLGIRDAIHMPAVVCKGDEPLIPGERILFTSSSSVKRARGEKYHGVVDPFLSGPAIAGCRFLVFVNPPLTTVPRHYFEIGVDEVENDPSNPPDECRWCS